MRALGRRAGVSATGAAGAVRSLAERGLVRRSSQWIAAGRAREVELIRPNVTARGWARLARRLAVVRPPSRRGQLRITPTRGHRGGVPTRLRHLFWNADPRRLDLRRHGGYIAERLVSSGDLDGLAWGTYALEAADWETAARNRGLSPEQRSLARNLARSGRLQAGLERPERRLEPTKRVGGLRIGGLGDLLAMKLNAIAGRAQLRDYFDLMTIELRGGRTVEEGLALFVERYRPQDQDSAIRPILLALGHFDDVAEDPFLPVDRAEIVEYWQRRQPEIVAALDRFGGPARTPEP